MKKHLIIFLSLILLTGFALAADCQPAGVPPKFYSGNVSYNNSLLDGIYLINATMDGQTVGQLEFSNGIYNKIEINPCSGAWGEIIFTVNGIEANERGYYNGTEDDDEWGAHITDFALTLNSQPPAIIYCGDGDINYEEECDDDNLNNSDGCSDTCEVESGYTCTGNPSVCSLIPTNNNDNGNTGGGGGGGGGGGSSTYTYLSATDTIEKDNYGEESPAIDPIDTTGKEKSKESNRGFLTGAVIGNLNSPLGWGILIALIIIVAGLIVIVKRRR